MYIYAPIVLTNQRSIVRGHRMSPGIGPRVINQLLTETCTSQGPDVAIHRRLSTLPDSQHSHPDLSLTLYASFRSASALVRDLFCIYTAVIWRKPIPGVKQSKNHLEKELHPPILCSFVLFEISLKHCNSCVNSLTKMKRIFQSWLRVRAQS